MNDEQLYCKLVAVADQKQVIVFLRFTPPTPSNDVEQGSIRLEITDGRDCWRSHDTVKADDVAKSARRVGRIKPFLEALGAMPPTYNYTFSLEEHKGAMTFNVLFNPSRTNSNEIFRLRCPVTPLPPHPLDGGGSATQAHIMAILQGLSTNLSRLRVAVSTLQREKVHLKNVGAEINATLKDTLAPAAALAQLRQYEGIAEMLNRKKAELRKARGDMEAGGGG